MKFNVEEKDNKKRLDKFLTENLSDWSRSQVQKIIKNNQVLLGNKPVSANYKVKIGDEIILEEPHNNFNSLLKEKASQFKLKDIEIIKATKDYVVVNKPAGLTVHGGEGVRGITLVDLLLEKYPNLRKIGDDPARPGIVHRLDKEVSGLMVIALNQNSFDDLKKQFQKRTVFKKYLALVYGAVDKEEGEIVFPIKRASNGKRMAAMPVTNRDELNIEQNGVRRAITSFQVKQKFINYTFLEIAIKTGRTHQIRVHMLAYGHPIVGDNLYSTARSRLQNKKIKLNRIFLVAYQLSFTDLNDEEQSFEIKLPNDLEEVLRKVK